MWIGATSHNTLLFFVWDFTHTHKHTQRDALKEWIYGLVICEKAKPPLNRRHSNSFFFLPKWAFKTRYVAKCAWIDVKRLHHHHHRRADPPRRHPRAGRASASFRLRGYCAISPRARLLLLLLLYVHTCAQPVSLGIYQFPFHLMCLVFAFAPALCLFVFHFLFCSVQLFCRKSQHVSYFLMGLPVGFSPTNRFYCSFTPSRCLCTTATSTCASVRMYCIFLSASTFVTCASISLTGSLSSSPAYALKKIICFDF